MCLVQVGVEILVMSFCMLIDLQLDGLFFISVFNSPTEFNTQFKFIPHPIPLQKSCSILMKLIAIARHCS
jgi:hypothetical protein